jgi:hypothetical protein
MISYINYRLKQRAGKFVTLLVGALNATHSSGMVVVADALAGVFIHPAITGTAATLMTHNNAE